MVASDGAVQRERSGPAPASDGLRADPEESSDLRSRQQSLGWALIKATCRQVPLVPIDAVHMGMFEQDDANVPGQM